jgi:hypothetical protein
MVRPKGLVRVINWFLINVESKTFSETMSISETKKYYANFKDGRRSWEECS